MREAKIAPFYFLKNVVKSYSILIIFVIQIPEKLNKTIA